MQIFITDYTGKRFWNTQVSVGFAAGERKNLARHLAMIQARRPAYDRCGVDYATARIEEELENHEIVEYMSDDELLNNLFS